MYDYEFVMMKKSLQIFINSLINRICEMSMTSEDERIINVDGGEANKNNEK